MCSLNVPAGLQQSVTLPVTFNDHKSVTRSIKCTHRNDPEDKQTEFLVHKHCTAGNEVSSVSAVGNPHLSLCHLISVLSAVSRLGSVKGLFSDWK